jgi:hypothetical protein
MNFRYETVAKAASSCVIISDSSLKFHEFVSKLYSLFKLLFGIDSHYDPFFKQWAIKGKCFVLSTFAANVQVETFILKSKVALVIESASTIRYYFLTIVHNKGYICAIVFPRCFSVKPIAATLMSIASTPAAAISAKSSFCSRRQRYANEINPSRLHLVGQFS